jgi:COP9 signalosome complex subunit 3
VRDHVPDFHLTHAQLLDPSVNTIAYIFALQARIALSGDSPLSPRHIPEPHKPGGAIWNKMTRFLETADSVQLRYVGAEWRRLVDYMQTVARVVGAVCVYLTQQSSLC